MVFNSKFSINLFIFLFFFLSFAQVQSQSKKRSPKYRAKHGFGDIQINKVGCELLKKYESIGKSQIVVAVIPFEVQKNVDLTHYDPSTILRDYFEAYLSEIPNWSLVDESRTKIFVDKLHDMIEENVFEEEEVRDIKERIGADVIIGGTVSDFQQGKYGTAGSSVNISVNGLELATSPIIFFSGTISAKSGSYEFDKSLFVMVNELVGKYVQEAMKQLNDCDKTE